MRCSTNVLKALLIWKESKDVREVEGEGEEEEEEIGFRFPPPIRTIWPFWIKF